MDVLHDNSHRIWLKITNVHENHIPDYVMDYTLPDKEAASKIDDNLFADSARRLFPIDTPAATWLSAAYYTKHANDGNLPYKKDEAKYVIDTIKTAAQIHGIDDDVEAIMAALAPQQTEKQAEDDNSNYGWVMRSNDTGEVIARKYPMFDARGVKKASAYFAENRMHYPLWVRRTIAKNIMAKAADVGVDTEELDPAVLREARYGIPRKDVLMSEIYERACLAKDAESAILLANINELIAGLPDSDIGKNLNKIAEVIDAFDRSAGLTKYYNVKILMPADFLFDVDLKTAEAAVEDAIELNKFVFSLTKLAELPPKVFGDVLGDGFVNAIVKSGEDSDKIDIDRLADNLYSLPRPDKVALEEHLIELF